MTTGAVYSLTQYRYVKSCPGPELKDVMRNRAAASGEMWAVAAAARLTPTSTLVMGTQKAPIPPSNAAAVATTQPRSLTSMAIAVYETASPPSARRDRVPA